MTSHNAEVLARHLPKGFLLRLIRLTETCISAASGFAVRHSYLGDDERVRFWLGQERTYVELHAVYCSGFEGRFGALGPRPWASTGSRARGKPAV